MSVMSVCVGTVEVVGLELYLACVLEGRSCRHGGSGVTLSVMSVCVDMVEVVGKELCLVCALRGRWWRRFGWLASGLM